MIPEPDLDEAVTQHSSLLILLENHMRHESSLRQFKAWKIAQLGNCKSLTIKLVGEIVCHFLLAIFLLNSLAMSQNQA